MRHIRMYYYYYYYYYSRKQKSHHQNVGIHAIHVSPCKINLRVNASGMHQNLHLPPETRLAKTQQRNTR